jgi:hypothetical protein
MIVNYNGTMVEINVALKCGITSVTSILAYPFCNKVLSKSKSRKILEPYSVHSSPYFYKNKEKLPIDIKIAIVRDPIKRIKSIWGDRIKRRNKPNLDDTSFEYFFRNFWPLHACPDIRKHSQTQVTFIGVNANYYDHIFDISLINTKFKNIIEKISNTAIVDIAINKSNKSNFKLTRKQFDFFKHVYSLDFDYYGMSIIKEEE